MTIYLAPEVASGLGEDTFWTWFKREVPESQWYDASIPITDNDVILRYSTTGSSLHPKQTICLLWELYPEMNAMLNTNEWDWRVNVINESIRTSRKCTVASEIMLPYYDHADTVDVLPLALDTEVFKPLNNKEELRKKYDLPLDKTIGVWGGTTHLMKGFDRFLEYKEANPNIHWIVIWKWWQEAQPVDGCSNYVQIPQTQMNELFNCGDFFLSTSRLRPYFMTEWEALAANMKFVFTHPIEKDFVPGKNPRQQVLDLGWDRITAKQTWLDYINNFIAENNA
jgi:hypothetical protein